MSETVNEGGTRDPAGTGVPTKSTTVGSPDVLADLVARVEKAEGPDRGLDVFVAQAVEKPATLLNGMTFDEAIAGFPHDLSSIANHWPVAPFTAAFDATLAMVERRISERHPGWTWNMKAVYGSGHGPYFWAEITWPSHECPGRGRTPALAMLAAGLRGIRDS